MNYYDIQVTASAFVWYLLLYHLSAARYDGALDVRDQNDLPAGEYLSRTSGGLTMVGTTSRKAAASAALLQNNYHALLLGTAGETHARLALDHDGTIRWGNGQGSGGAVGYQQRAVVGP